MHLNHRLEDRTLDAKAHHPSRARRSDDFQPVLQLKSIEAFGAQIQRKLITCRSAGKRPFVLLVSAEVLDGGVPRDELLTAFGARLHSRVRPTDLVVQIGECFGVYFHGDVALHATSIRERLRLALQEEFGFGQENLRIHPRFGMAVHPGTPISGVDLVSEAAQAFED